MRVARLARYWRVSRTCIAWLWRASPKISGKLVGSLTYRLTQQLIHKLCTSVYWWPKKNTNFNSKTLLLLVLLYGCQAWTVNVTGRSKWTSLVWNTSTRFWYITGVSVCRNIDCSISVNRTLLPAYCVKGKRGCIGMWHVVWKSTLHIISFM